MAGKPLVVVFSAPWCPPCQANKKTVYPNDQVKPYHDKFVWVYLDTDVKKNAAAAKQFSVSGIPHIEFVSKDGTSIDKKIGGTNPRSFAKTLKKVLRKAAD
jgi:thioredoxin-like negative regulator of GroEL